MYKPQEDEIEQSEKNVVNIFPLSKWRRVLVFLGDLFINFIICFILLNVMVMPIGKLITGFDCKSQLYEQSNEAMHTILYENKVVLASPKYSKDEINSNIKYTYDCWLSYYALDSENSPDPTYIDYGHKVDNEVIYHFYHVIRSDDAKYNSLFDNYNKDNSYFIKNESNLYTLKDTIKAQVSPYFDPKDEL